MNRAGPQCETRLRVTRNGRPLFGPGKAALLRQIALAGSIRTAARHMKMSYNRAWSLVREMNGQFAAPLVAISRGGKTGGGAALTPAGRRVLALYSRMEKNCRSVMRREWTLLRGLLK